MLTVIRRAARRTPLRAAAARTRSRAWSIDGVGKADEGEGRKPCGDVGLDLDQGPVEPGETDRERARRAPCSDRFEVLEGEGAVEVGVDPDDVDAHVAVRGRTLHEVLPGKAPQTAQLRRRHCRLRDPGDERATCLDLDEDERGVREGDDVELPLAQAQVAFDDLPSAGDQMLGDEVLPRLPSSEVVISATRRRRGGATGPAGPAVQRRRRSPGTAPRGGRAGSESGLWMACARGCCDREERATLLAVSVRGMWDPAKWHGGVEMGGDEVG